MSLNKTLIPWVKNPDGSQGYTLNHKTGCLNRTPKGLCLGGLFPCFAYKLANGRLNQRYLANHNLAGGYRLARGVLKEGAILPSLDPFYPRHWPEKLEQIRQRKKPAGIFLDDMSDWMGDYWPEEWTEAELQVMRDCPQHRFYTLTKQPQNLPQWSPFPENCWVGVTATSKRMAWEADKWLGRIEAKVKYLSIEPLLEWYRADFGGDFLTRTNANWVILGACTGSKKDMEELISWCWDPSLMPWGKKWTAQPRIEWVQEIVLSADSAGIPVFLKDNLAPLLYVNNYEHYGIRQEVP